LLKEDLSGRCEYYFRASVKEVEADFDASMGYTFVGVLVTGVVLSIAELRLEPPNGIQGIH